MLGYKLDFVRTNFKRSFQILNAFLLQRKGFVLSKAKWANQLPASLSVRVIKLSS